MGKIWTKYMAFLVCICVLACLTLAVGITYGRYQWEFPKKSYVFAPVAPDSLYLYGGGVSEEWIQGGNLPPVANTWEQIDGGVKLDFSVTNGQIDSVSWNDQTYVVRLVAGLNIRDPQNLAITLSWTDTEGQTHLATGVPAAIEKGSLLHNSFGEGWVYQFQTQGTEELFSLTGGQLRYCNFTVTVLGEVDASLLNLQILGQD